MRVMFCSDPLNSREPDSEYEREVAAATAAGLEWSLVDFEALTNDGDAAAAVRRVTRSVSGEPGLFRGWMLRPAVYTELFAALARQTAGR